MNKKLLKAGLGAVALIAIAVPAQAQTSTPTGFSIKAGAFFPSNRQVRRDTSDTWFTAGVDYRIKEFPVTTPDYRSHLSISLDWMGSGNTHSIPLLLNYVGEQREFYWLIGAGAAFNHSSGSDNTRFGYALGLGYNFDQHGTTPAFIEARWLGTSKARESGIAVDLGIRL
ncbi:MAG: hypothetical protein QOJ65_611 [Fimbriimonadaceae bacterium]|jgi:hypothetical protein|nr:hypothetical protein [Fimbriimonadaceae bacterium]